MESSQSDIKKNIVYGVAVLVPVSVLFLVAAKIVEILETLAESLDLRSNVSAVLAIILAVLILLILCFVAGTLVRTRIGSWSFERFENKVLKPIPGYEIIANVLKNFAEDRSAYSAAMVELYGPGTAVFGFVMEENENDTLTIFVPLTPVMTVGNVHVVKRDLVTILDAPTDVSGCISNWGIGSRKLLGGNRP
jgi:uncharacterized membrane protein